MVFVDYDYGKDYDKDYGKDYGRDGEIILVYLCWLQVIARVILKGRQRDEVRRQDGAMEVTSFKDGRKGQEPGI